MVKVKLEEMMFKSYRDVYYMSEDMSEEFGYSIPPKMIHEAAMNLFYFRANRRLQLITTVESARNAPDDRLGTM